MKSLFDIKEKIRLLSALPGRSAQLTMMPSARLMGTSTLMKEAAVTILLYESESEVYFILIRRVDDGFVHSKQMALPGGGISGSEDLQETALRELQEEIGAKRDQIEVQCALTPLPIPVSGFLVHPFVAITSQIDGWIAQRSEVEEIYTVSLSELLDPNSRRVASLDTKGVPVDAPFFLLLGQNVWGATAMILAEFRALLS